MDHKDKKKDRIIRKLELIEFLDLSEEQAEKFFVKFNDLNKDNEKLNKKNKELLEQAYDLIETKNINSTKIDLIINEYYDNHFKIIELKKNYHNDVKKYLDDKQILKLMLFKGYSNKKGKGKFFHEDNAKEFYKNY